jgi:hypothetical protein
MTDIERQIRAKIIPLLILFILFIIPIIMKYFEAQKELHKFQKKEIHGKIIWLDDLNRGYFELKIKSAKNKYLTPTFILGSAVDEGKVKIGDSISKNSNNNLVYFYRLRNGKYMETHRFIIY